MNDLEVRMWPIDRPIPYARNSRKIPERAVDKVAASIKSFGFRVPIVVDRDGVIICGHCRLLASKKLGLLVSAEKRERRPGMNRKRPLANEAAHRCGVASPLFRGFRDRDCGRDSH